MKFFYALTVLPVGIFIGFLLKKWVHTIELSHAVNWAAETIAHESRDINFVDAWDPVNKELRQYRVLASVDDAESEKEYIRECPSGLARCMKLDAKRRRTYGYSETDPMNAYGLN
eukprot:s1775_g16.t1